MARIIRNRFGQPIGQLNLFYYHINQGSPARFYYRRENGGRYVYEDIPNSTIGHHYDSSGRNLIHRFRNGMPYWINLSTVI